MGAMLWRHSGRDHVTVVVKTGHALVPEGIMTPLPAEPVRLEDEHVEHNPTRSLVGPTELLPMLQRAEVIATGHARGPDVRLKIVGATGTALDKALRADVTHGPIFLGLESAYGGIGFADNPLGVGFGDGRTPPLSNPGAPNVPASLVAVPRTFPQRRKKLGKTKRQDVCGLRADIPAVFDWSYYQAAPEDQQIDRLDGDEWILLEGLDRDGKLRTQLPGGRGVVKIYGAERAGAPGLMALRLDMLLIDVDQRRCSAVWRGHVSVTDRATLAELVFAGAYDRIGVPLVWPDAKELRVLPFEPDPSVAKVARPAFDETRELGKTAVRAAVERAALPFAGDSAPPPIVPVAKELTGTIAVEPGRRRTTPPVPFARVRPNEAPPSDTPSAAPEADDAEQNEANEQAALGAARAAEEAAAAERRREEAARAAERDAQDRRHAEQKRFEEEQAQALEAEARKEAAREANRKKDAEQVRTGMYGAFKRPR